MDSDDDECIPSKMDSDDDDECMPSKNFRQFSYALIVWEVKNYFIETSKNNAEILSPEFTIERPFKTKWLFKLITEGFRDGMSVGYIILKRLPCENGPEKVHVCLKASLTSNNVELFDVKCTLEENEELTAQIRKIRSFKRAIKENSDLQLPSSIYFKFTILIKSKDYASNFFGSNALNLTDLAKEISIPLDTINYQDFLIEVNKLAILCHKALLSAVNNFLDSAVGESLEHLENQFKCGRTIRKLVRYFYSGNLDHILKYPRILLDEELKRFRVKEAEEYYLKDAINLLTWLEATSFHFKWVIMDSSTMNQHKMIISPKFTKRDMNVAFQLHLVKREESGDLVTKIVLVIIGGWMPHELFLVYDFMDINNCVFNRRIIRWDFGEQTEVGNVYGDKVPDENYHEWTIACQVYVPIKNGATRNVDLFRQSMSTEIDYENHYSLLSNRLEKMYNKPKYSDLVIYCGGRVFKVHKFVLNVRSTLLKLAIDQLAEEEKGFKMDDFDPDVLNIVLKYIYTSNIKDFSRVYEVYIAADLLKIPSLKVACLQKIREDIESKDPLKVLLESIDFNLPQIEAKAARYIKENVSKFKMQGAHWERLKSYRPSFFEEVKNLLDNIKVEVAPVDSESH